jgi:hypothetical protein
MNDLSKYLNMSENEINNLIDNISNPNFIYEFPKTNELLDDVYNLNMS